jgi:hypothetical protein
VAHAIAAASKAHALCAMLVVSHMCDEKTATKALSLLAK